MAARKTNLFAVLTGIFITNAILAEMIGTKIFSFEKTLGFNPVQFNIFADYTLDFNLTAGVLIWPVVFISTDVINEYFGKKGVKRISYFTVILIAYCFAIIWLSIHLAPADFWLDVNRDTDANFNIDNAYGRIFGQGINIIVGSLFAFLVGQLLDAYVFQRIKRFTGQKMVWLRATGSTLISQLVDSYVVLFIAFYLMVPEQYKWSLEQVIAVGSMNYIYKFFVAVILTPVIYLGHYLIDKYLGKELSDSMKEEALRGG
ncbi:MAG: queuosine precursor transporter [Cyclobacteriaceae bacterium]